jgi:hypothetical protein
MHLVCIAQNVVYWIMTLRNLQTTITKYHMLKPHLRENLAFNINFHVYGGALRTLGRLKCRHLRDANGSFQVFIATSVQKMLCSFVGRYH